MVGEATNVALVNMELEREKVRAALDVGAALALRWCEDPNEGVVVPGRLVVEKLWLTGLVTLESGGRMPEVERTARPWA
jgi:hypothetical protein